MEELAELESDTESTFLSELKNSIESASPGTFKLFFILRTKKEGKMTYKVFRAKTQPNVRKELKGIIKAKIKKITVKEETLEYVKYDPAMDADPGTIEIISGESVKCFENILGEMEPVSNIYEMKTKEVPWAYAITVDDIGAIFFRKFSRSRMLQKKGWIPLLVEKNEFTKIDDPGLSIDEDFDCIYFKESEELYILDRDRFEAIFNFFDEFKEYISKNLSTLDNFVYDKNKVWELCETDPKKVRKLYQILSSNILDELKMSKIEGINEKYELKLPFENRRIKVSRKNIWIVLRVLNDDYLDSSMTDNKYLALLKRKK